MDRLRWTLEDVRSELLAQTAGATVPVRLSDLWLARLERAAEVALVLDLHPDKPLAMGTLASAVMKLWSDQNNESATPLSGRDLYRLCGLYRCELALEAVLRAGPADTEHASLDTALLDRPLDPMVAAALAARILERPAQAVH